MGPPVGYLHAGGQSSFPVEINLSSQKIIPLQNYILIVVSFISTIVCFLKCLLLFLFLS